MTMIFQARDAATHQAAYADALSAAKRAMRIIIAQAIERAPSWRHDAIDRKMAPALGQQYFDILPSVHISTHWPVVRTQYAHATRRSPPYAYQNRNTTTTRGARA